MAEVERAEIIFYEIEQNLAPPSLASKENSFYCGVSCNVNLVQSTIMSEFTVCRDQGESQTNK